MNFVMRDVEPENDDAQELQDHLVGGAGGGGGGAAGSGSGSGAGSSGSGDGSTDTGGADEIVDETEFVASGEKKRISQTAMMMFAILAIGGAGLFLMYRRVTPQTAVAADPQVAAAQQTISDFMQRGNSNVAMLRKLLDGTERLIQQFKMPQVIQVPLRDLRANPFRFTATPKPAPTDDGGDAARKRKEAEKLAVQNAARGLNLQSLIVRGSRKACMINNVMYQEGQAIDDFTVESITSEGVVVKKDAYRFRLQIAQPAH